METAVAMAAAVGSASSPELLPGRRPQRPQLRLVCGGQLRWSAPASRLNEVSYLSDSAGSPRGTGSPMGRGARRGSPTKGVGCELAPIVQRPASPTRASDPLLSRLAREVASSDHMRAIKHSKSSHQMALRSPVSHLSESPWSAEQGRMRSLTASYSTCSQESLQPLPENGGVLLTRASTRGADLWKPRPRTEPPFKPPSRSEVVRLDLALQDALSSADADLQTSMEAWELAFTELIRQVTVHMTERGALLLKLHDQCVEWMHQLIERNAQLEEKMTALNGQERREQSLHEERLKELLHRNRTLEHKIALLSRELAWLQGGGKKMEEASTTKQQSSETEGEKKGGEAAAEGEETVTVDGAVALVRKVGQAQGREVAMQLIVHATADFDMDEKIELCRQLATELDPLSALTLRAVLLTPFSPGEMKGLVEELSQDEAGTMCCVNLRTALDDVDIHVSTLQRLFSRLFKSGSSKHREDALQALNTLLSDDERQRLARKVMKSNEQEPAPFRPMRRVASEFNVNASTPSASRQASAGKPTIKSLASINAAFSKSHKSVNSSTRSIVLNRQVTFRAAEKAEVSAPPADPEKQEDNTKADEALRMGGKTIQALLLRRPFSTKRLGLRELLRYISGAVSTGSLANHIELHLSDLLVSAQQVIMHKLALDMETNDPEAISLSDALWQYLNRTSGSRESATTQLRNIHEACTLLISKQHLAGWSRICAFSHITGLGINCSDIWGKQKAKLYLATVSYLLPDPDRGYDQAERDLSMESMYVPLSQAESCVSTVVADYGLLQDLKRRISNPGNECLQARKVVRGGADDSSTRGHMISVDWLLDVLLQEYEDALLPAKRKLQSAYEGADANEGVFTMADFSLFVRNIRGVREMPEHVIFALFNDCLHMTEMILGHESEAISQDAFVICAIENEILQKTQVAFNLIPPAPIAITKPKNMPIQEVGRRRVVAND